MRCVLKISRVESFLKNNKKISFNRSYYEHKSWGVNPEPDSDKTTVKLFSYPDNQSVNILVNPNTPNQKSYPLEGNVFGVYTARLSREQLDHGDLYQFKIKRENGCVEIVKDPYSFKQPTLSGPSEVYDHHKYKWNDKAWFSDDNKARISRLADDKNGLTPVGAALIYEVNIATLTPDGDLEGAKKELEKIKKMGFNAIELMPMENTYSYNWGYDGVDKFAPAQYLGGPDKLKEFVDDAHKVGLNVIMDMVPNHLGPDGAQLQRTGPYMSGSTDWGEAFNYEGKDSRYVRDFIVNAALNWVQNYHCDGIRFDMTKFMNSDTTMQQIAAELNTHCPDAFLIAEDGRSNVSVRGNEYWNDYWQPHDERVIKPLMPIESGSGKYTYLHKSKINDIENSKLPLARLGFDSEWDFHFYHTLTKLAYGEADLDALERAIAESGNRVKYSTSHDETGNLDGTRLVAKYMVPELKLLEYTYLQDEDEKRAVDYVAMKKDNGINISLEDAKKVVKSQKAQQISMKLAQMIQSGRMKQYKKMPPSSFEMSVLDSLGIAKNSYLTPDVIIQAFEKSVRKYRAIEALKYFTPGPVMTFQGEDRLEMVKFNFFREFESIKDEKYLYTQKGYPNGISAYQNSILGNFEYDYDGEVRMAKFQSLIRDLNRFKKENPSSTVGKIVLKDTVKHPQNPTIALHALDEKTGNETFVVSNFSSVDYPKYEIKFPEGIWQEEINTNHGIYGGDNKCINGYNPIHSFEDGYKCNIALPAYSTIVFVKRENPVNLPLHSIDEINDWYN